MELELILSGSHLIGMLGTKRWFFARVENVLMVQALSLGLQSCIFKNCTFFVLQGYDVNVCKYAWSVMWTHVYGDVHV